MSVIVKGMEMPKYCYDCPLQDGETGRCNILKITVCDYIPKECPLVEVVRCRECKWSDTFSDITAEPHSPLKCLGIRYGGVNEDWFCEHGERRDDG